MGHIGPIVSSPIFVDNRGSNWGVMGKLVHSRCHLGIFAEVLTIAVLIQKPLSGG